jgi:hypothetical protein
MLMLLTPATIDFMESGEVSIYVAACSTQLRPIAARAFGCRVSRETGSVTTWVSRPAALRLLDDISVNGRLALVVSHIETCKTLQLKAVDAEVATPDASDQQRIADYHDAFIEQAITMGYPEAMLRSMLQYRFDKFASVVFTPSAVFAQTPGPGAGTAVTGESEQ